MNGNPMSSVRNRVDNWMARHNPDLQGKTDAALETDDDLKYSSSLYEKRIVENYEKEIRILDHEFTERDSSLYKSLQESRAELSTLRKLATPAPVQSEDTADNDRVFKISLPILEVSYLICFLFLTALNSFFLFPESQEGLELWIISGILSSAILAAAFFTGKLLHNDYGWWWLLKAAILANVGLLCIFAVLLDQGEYGWEVSIAVLLNVVIFVVAVITTFFSHDAGKVRPARRRKAARHEIRKRKKLLREISSLRAQRSNNKEHYVKLQAVFVEAAQELVTFYRIVLTSNISGRGGMEIAETPLPEFKTIEFRMLNEPDNQEF